MKCVSDAKMLDILVERMNFADPHYKCNRLVVVGYNFLFPSYFRQFIVIPVRTTIPPKKQQQQPSIYIYGFWIATNMECDREWSKKTHLRFKISIHCLAQWTRQSLTCHCNAKKSTRKHNTNFMNDERATRIEPHKKKTNTHTGNYTARRVPQNICTNCLCRCGPFRSKSCDCPAIN